MFSDFSFFICMNLWLKIGMIRFLCKAYTILKQDTKDFHMLPYLSLTPAGIIGLKNVRRRLDLLYPKKHKLEINDRGSEFYVALTLKMEQPEPGDVNEN